MLNTPNKNLSTNATKASTYRTKRQYLPAAERKQQILEAAFHEFSSGGFLATSIDSIAKNAGISKSGIYSHYKSKDEIFAEMLLFTLLPADTRIPDLDRAKASDLPQLIDHYLNRRYRSLSSKRAMAAFRLLIAESGRAPEIVQQCAQRLLQRSMAGDRNFILACIEKELVQPKIKIDEYLLTNSPAGLWLILITIFGVEKAPISLDQVKAQHKKLLLMLLQP